MSALGEQISSRLRRVDVRQLRVPRTVREEPILFGLAALAAIAYGTHGFVQHAHFQTHGFDLGIFDQAVWNYSHFHTPASTIRDVSNVLGDHFSPIIATLAPLYWIWADPRTLIAAQAVLIAASAVPVFLYSRGRIGRTASYLLALAYLLFWGTASAIAYDFHEVAFAPLLIALAIYWSDKKSWRGYWTAVALLILVKEDLTIFVVFLGIYLALRKELRRGAITAAVGVASYFLLTELVIPAFAGGAAYHYWTYDTIGSNPLDAAWNAIRDPGLIPRHLTDDPTKTRTLKYLASAFLALVVLSPLVVLVVPLVLERMLSSRFVFWNTDQHYSLTIAPVLAMGAADGLRNVFVKLGYREWLAPIAIQCMAVILLIAFVRVPDFPLWDLTHGKFYAAKPGEASVRRAIARVPDGPSVMAQDTLLPHLSERKEIYPFDSGSPPTAYIVADLEHIERGVFPQQSLPAQSQFVRSYCLQYHYRTIFRENGIYVLKRPGASGDSQPDEGHSCAVDLK